jgi:hypothetical protein
MATGQYCPQSGIWISNCHNGHREQIALSRGEKFPPCSHCRGGATWTLLNPTRQS